LSDKNLDLVKIYIAILSYNRTKEFIISLNSVMKSVESLNKAVQFEIKIFDDHSERDCYEQIKKNILLYDNNDISIVRNKKNLGYAKNYYSAIQWYVSNKNKKSFFYLHESDLYLEKFWLNKCLLLFKKNSNKVITPLHHRNHLFKKIHSQKIYKNFCKYLGKKFLNKNQINYKKIYFYEGRFLQKILNVKAFSSFAGIGARIGNFFYWKKIIDNKILFFRHPGMEDMVLSFFAKKNGTYFVPGSAKVALKPGLNGYMFLNVASFDGILTKYIFVYKLKIFVLLKLYSILKFFKISKYFKLILNYIYK
jgi:hypothetical protein